MEIGKDLRKDRMLQLKKIVNLWPDIQMVEQIDKLVKGLIDRKMDKQRDRQMIYKWINRLKP